MVCQEAKKDERQFPKCPFAAETLTAALAEFLANPGWKRIYDDVPRGARRRLEMMYWFSKNEATRREPETVMQYRKWREDVERSMTDEELLYMFKTFDRPATKEHYAALLKGRREQRHVNASGNALM